MSRLWAAGPFVGGRREGDAPLGGPGRAGPWRVGVSPVGGGGQAQETAGAPAAETGGRFARVLSGNGKRAAVYPGGSSAGTAVSTG